MQILPAVIRRALRPDPEATRLRDQCERLRDDARMREADTRDAESQLEAVDAHMRKLEEMQRAAATRIRVFDWTGKTAAAGVVVGLAVGSSLGLLPAAGLFVGGLAGFCASYLAQFKSRARWQAIEGARGDTSREREAAQRRIDLNRQAALDATSRLRATEDRLRTLEVTRMAEHANQGPPAGAVEVEEGAVRLGGIRVPRNVQTP